jgi:CRISPR-associated protein Cmr6
MMNFSYLFHVDYYEGLKREHFHDCNNKLFAQRFKQTQITEDGNPLCRPESSFVLKVAQYPGLLIGLGNVHAAGSDNVEGRAIDGAEIGLGFTLDYVTGLPYIPGSTVKGVLRSVFRHHPEFVYDYLLEDLPTLKALVKPEKVESEIWEKIGKKIFGSEEGKGGCVFFDAFPIKTAESGTLFAMENITPHKAEDPNYDGLLEPVPLYLLKVIGGTEFLFRFDMQNLEEYNSVGIAAEDILKIFKKTLLTLGIGAKTNVGFGKLEEGTGGSLYCILDYEGGSSTESNTSGKCKRCRAEVKQNAKTGKYYEYCNKCQNELNNEKAKEAKLKEQEAFKAKKGGKK